MTHPGNNNPHGPSDEDNPAQVAALRKVHDAIDELAKTLGDPGILVEWVLVSCTHHDHGDGTNGSAYRLNGLPVDNAPHRVRGLLELGARMVP